MNEVQLPDDVVPSIFDPLTATAIATWVRHSDWAYPILETLHVLGLALVFAPILLFDLHILGYYARQSTVDWHRALLPWVWFGFALNALSGALMFASDAGEIAANPAFQFKMALLLIAALNAAFFQWRLFDASAAPGAQSTAARFSAATSIVLWITIISAGRLMAYMK